MSERNRLRQFVDEVGDDLFGEHPLLLMDGYDDCIVGVAWQFGKPMVVYDRRRVIQKLMSDGMNEEEATEFHHFNQSGAWQGVGTPAFLDRPEDITSGEDDSEPWTEQ